MDIVFSNGPLCILDVEEYNFYLQSPFQKFQKLHRDYDDYSWRWIIMPSAQIQKDEECGFAVSYTW